MPELPRANLSFPTRYRLGWGRRAELAAELKVAGVARGLVITDPTVAKLPWFADTVAAGGPAIAGVWTEVSTNPTEAEVLAALARYRELGADGVVAIGGGAPMDAAKVVALLAHAGAGAPGDVAAFAVGGARARSITGAAPIVALPTTAGTGSELSTGAVISDPGASRKRTLLHPALLPRAVIADAETTVGLPAFATAATGFDALTHAIEALCAPGYNPMADAIAVEAIGMIGDHLARVVRNPDNAPGRCALLHASGLAAVGFQKGLGLCHAMAHALGAMTGMHHGLANAILLDLVLEANAEAIAAPCARIAARLGLAGEPVAAVIAWVRALRAEVGLPSRSPVDVDDRMLVVLLAGAQAETLYLATNPREVLGERMAWIYLCVLGKLRPS